MSLNQKIAHPLLLVLEAKSVHFVFWVAGTFISKFDAKQSDNC